MMPKNCSFCVKKKKIEKKKNCNNVKWRKEEILSFEMRGGKKLEKLADQVANQ